MRTRYNFAKMKGRANPYRSRIKQLGARRPTTQSPQELEDYLDLHDAQAALAEVRKKGTKTLEAVIKKLRRR